ncbi:hypothetical protein Bca4012_065607 [Brassica carinata]
MIHCVCYESNELCCEWRFQWSNNVFRGEEYETTRMNPNQRQRPVTELGTSSSPPNDERRRIQMCSSPQI